MYITVVNARARAELGLSEVADYSNAVIEVLIKKTQAFIDAYLHQTLELTEDIEEEALSIPMSNGGLHIQLLRRYITEVSEVLVQYGYGNGDITIASDNYILISDLGIIETNYGACKEKMFEEERHSKYNVKVTYDAGIDPIPDDFLEAFYEVLYKIKQHYDADTTTETSAVSNKIKEYRTLNETIKFAEDKIKDMLAKNVIEGAVENILNKYRMPEIGIGVYM